MKRGKSDNFLGYWTFPPWRIGCWIFNYFHILCAAPLKMKTNQNLLYAPLRPALELIYRLARPVESAEAAKRC
jgi:hypothetical protein